MLWFELLCQDGPYHMLIPYDETDPAYATLFARLPHAFHDIEQMKLGKTDILKEEIQRMIIDGLKVHKCEDAMKEILFALAEEESLLCRMAMIVTLMTAQVGLILSRR